MRDLIRGLARPALRLLRHDERGVVAVIVGLLIGTVLLGLGALVIDVGQLYQERAELQSGADAAANAVAKSCVLSDLHRRRRAEHRADLRRRELQERRRRGQPGLRLGRPGCLRPSTGALTDCPSRAGRPAPTTWTCTPPP